MSQYNRANVSIEPGRIDRVSVVPLAENKDMGLLTIVGSEARVVIEVQIDDLWRLATACRNAVKRHEEECRMDDLAAESEVARLDPIPTGRELANAMFDDIVKTTARWNA